MNMELHEKMYKSSKQWALSATAVLALLSVGTVVAKADDTVSSQNSNAKKVLLSDPTAKSTTLKASKQTLQTAATSTNDVKVTNLGNASDSQFSEAKKTAANDYKNTNVAQKVTRVDAESTNSMAANETTDANGNTIYTEPSQSATDKSPWDGIPPFTYLNDPTNATKWLPYDDPQYKPYPIKKGWTGYVYYQTENADRGSQWSAKGFHKLSPVDPNDLSKGYAYAPYEAPNNPFLDTYYYIYPDAQQAAIFYLDDDTMKQLHVTVLFDGRTSSISNFDQTDELAGYLAKGYKVVSNGFVPGFKYGDGSAPQNFLVHLKHGTSVETQHKTVTETIHYKYSDGTTASPDVVKTVKFSRDLTTDLVTKAVTTGKWVSDDGSTSFPLEKSPQITGYTADKAEIAAVDSVTADTADLTYTVTYSKDKVAVPQTPAPGVTKTPTTPEKPIATVPSEKLTKVTNPMPIAHGKVTLPKTGEQSDSLMAQIGLVLFGLVWPDWNQCVPS